MHFKISRFHCPCTGPQEQHQQFTLGPGSTAQGQETQDAKCALLYSAVPHSFGHESYSPKEALKTISLSRQDFQTNTAFYPLMQKESAGD